MVSNNKKEKEEKIAEKKGTLRTESKWKITKFPRLARG